MRHRSSVTASPIVFITMRTPRVETALVWIELWRTNRASRVIVVRSIRLAGSTQDRGLPISSSIACVPSQALSKMVLRPLEEPMAKTRTPSITILADGRRFIDKRYLGVRIGVRVGSVTQEQAEERLQNEIARVQCDVPRKAHARPTFTDCAARYVE